ncbi:MAG: hypothetical protein ACTSQS_03030 [Promethearchaeota archaeon]
MKYKYIKDTIVARLAGTAIHLNESDGKKRSPAISYKKYRVWGIKTLINNLIDDIFYILYEYLPENEKDFYPEEDLKKPLEILCKRYQISYNRLIDFIDKRKKPSVIWNSLDDDQRAIFMINAFFEAFEENLINSYFIAMSFVKLLSLNSLKEPKLKYDDFFKGDFGFVFRARGYAYFYSKILCNNGFSNVVKRLNKILLKEYENLFIDKDQNNIDLKEKSSSSEELSEEKRYVISMLKEGNSEEKLNAIELILEHHIIEAVDELEYLLKDNDENVMNAALDAILKLKDLS